MKKKLLSFCADIILLCIITHSSNAQDLDSIVKPHLPSFSKKSYATFHEKHSTGDSGSLRLNEHNPMSVRSFVRDFGNVSDVRWIKSEKGLFVAYFIDDSIQNWVVYNSRGTCESIIRYYYQDKLPRYVRHLVKSAYYDFSIFCVNELTVNGITAYTVTLTDKTTDTIFWKIVQIVGSEIELMKEYSQKLHQQD